MAENNPVTHYDLLHDILHNLKNPDNDKGATKQLMDEIIDKAYRPIPVYVYRTNLEAKLPVRATKGSSGYDVFATEDVTISAGERRVLSTGLIVRIPQGYEFQIRSKSGLAARAAIAVLNSPGTIDSDYRGDLGVIIVNHGGRDYTFKRGDKIAQIVCQQIEDVEFIELTEETKYLLEDNDNERSTGGFGSTGR